MTSPMRAMSTLQNGYLEGCCRVVQLQLGYWRHCFDVQSRFMREPRQRQKVELAQGPSLTDHYGKRAHDIDPERDV